MKTFNAFTGEIATQLLESAPEVIAEGEGKSWKVHAEVSHPMNRSMSVTKHIPVKADSEAEARKKAKAHIKSQGWIHHGISKVIEEEVDDTTSTEREDEGTVEEGAVPDGADDLADLDSGLAGELDEAVHPDTQKAWNKELGRGKEKPLTKTQEIEVAKGSRHGDYKGHRAAMCKKHNIPFK